VPPRVETEQKTNNMPKFICVGVYSTRLMGEMAEGLLKSNGIKSFISGTHHAGPHLESAAGIRVWVHQEEKERAIDVLRGMVGNSGD
jgi:hypothetical protein